MNSKPGDQDSSPNSAISNYTTNMTLSKSLLLTFQLFPNVKLESVILNSGARYSTLSKGVPAMVQWVKNLGSGTQVATEVGVGSPTWHRGLKDLALLRLQYAAGIQSLAQELP